VKVWIFLWQLAKNRPPAAQQIRERHGPSNGNCVLCARPKDLRHIFFSCPLAQFLWSAVRSLLNVSWNPSCFADIFAIFQHFHDRTRKLLWLLFAAQCWALWLTRNKATIEAKFPRQPANLIFKTLILLQQWRGLQRDDVSPLLDELIALLKDVYAKTLSTPVAATGDA
jgi:hypothetical protein